MTKFKKYWKGAEELESNVDFLENQKNEFSEDLPLDEVLNETNFELNSNRRDFLKFFGFSVTAVALASCNKAPVKKAIPYLVRPENVVNGEALYYNTTCGITSMPITVKVREGRPIKVDGNENDKETNGGLDARGQASILNLYDKERLTGPKKIQEGTALDIDWKTVDFDIKSKLAKVAASGKKIVVLSSSINSPSTLEAINHFKTNFATAQHVTYDAVSYSGMLDANEASFGKRVIPSYRFDKADVIVSFGADFLGTWLNGTINSAQYTSNRVPTKENGGKMSRHIHFESLMSLTGANADFRVPMMSSKEGKYLISLYTYLKGGKGQEELAGNAIKNAAKELRGAQGKSLVVSGSNNVAIQNLVNIINAELGNYGSTIDLQNHSNQYKGSDAEYNTFVKEMNAGSVGAVICYGVNPMYNHPKADLVKSGFSKVGLLVSTSMTLDETAKNVHYVCPDNHALESWGDAQLTNNKYSFLQPTISPVFDTRQAPLSFLTWSGYTDATTEDVLAKKGHMAEKFEADAYYNFVRKVWKTKMSVQSKYTNFEKFWVSVLHDGFFKVNSVEAAPVSLNILASSVEAELARAKESNLELIVYEKAGVGDGTYANNPWLHEMPDPVTKVCWDNYVTISKYYAEEKGIEEGNTVNITANGHTLENVPVVIQPGQYRNSIGIALGYGRTSCGQAGNNIGHNAYPFVNYTNGVQDLISANPEIKLTVNDYELARTQSHHSFEGRDIVREISLDQYKENPKTGNDHKHHLYSLWDNHDYATGHHWAMAIDMNACTGCSSCIVSCSIENNVPVVGRDEVRRRREMHWLRIDRYYSFEGEIKEEHGEEHGHKGHGPDLNEGYLTKEKEIEKMDETGKFDHWENVKVIHQPMLCQHCDNAPCETVCPVLATTHSTEGLNQMTYNRCIGTKYCGNNCPYKVRRFNWFRYNDNDQFDFHFNNDLGKMVINPDVTVRTRGVMEKCSFCVQTIQTKKLEAKREGRKLRDGDVKTACQKSCPTNAIVFGDRNDPNSEVSKRLQNDRNYYVLEEIGVKPSIGYSLKVRNSKSTDKKTV